MKLQLYNTLTRKKETFKPIRKDLVGIYSCGPTVYWYQHIGNLRTYIFSDILKRVLLYNGFKVKHVMNITDVGHLTSDSDEGEDKMEAAAKREHKTAAEIANYYWKLFLEDFKKLNIIEPDIWCKATEHIKEQIELIQKLEKKGYTYRTDDGIYFNSRKFKNYGKLAKLKIKALKAGARVSLGKKKNSTDFALWKFSENPGKRQQEWNPKDFGADWPIGFPGWHIECSAMSMRYLGEHFDIHTGGEEHIPVHHTNEIAQSEAVTGKKFVNYWLHARWLLFKGEKMAKSKGHIYTISELQEKGFEPLVFRYFCLTAHYRTQLNFSLQNLEAAKNAFNSLKNKILEIKQNFGLRDARSEKILHYKKEFLKILNDDLDMPKALALLWQVIRNEELQNNEKYALILNFDKIFGLDIDKVEKVKIELSEKIKKFIQEREEARKNKNFKKADKIREQIRKQGFIVEDTDEGPRIKKL